MDGKIAYLNTDLDIVSTEDLSAIANALESSGVSPLHVAQGDDARWYATFETDEQFSEPEANIAAMLAVLESLDAELLQVWNSCSKREFNIGYDCGREPWAFNQAICAETLKRMGRAGATLRITIYPDREDRTANSTA